MFTKRKETKKKEFIWALKAANLGFTSEMGDYYYDGIGTEVNYSEAYKWYIKANENLKIAEMYYNGIGVTQNYELAAKYYLATIEKDKKQLSGKPDMTLDEALKVFGHETGFASSKLGEMYYYGFFYEKDLKKAAELFKKAVFVGDSYAMCFLGILYDRGEGVLKDPKQAFKLFMESAEKSDACGQYNLGLCYLQGDGTIPNKKKAAEWIKKAFENGHSEAEKVWNEQRLWNYLD